MQPLNAPLGVPAAATTAQAPTAPATREVPQTAAPAGFDIMQYATCKVKAESSSSRKPNWECTAAELRERVTFRDVQAVSKRNPAEYHLRPFLSPKSLELAPIFGENADGPINTIVVPAELAEATKQQFIDRVVNSGALDSQLLEVAQQMKLDKEERDAAPKKAPVNTAAADAALADLEATVNVPVQVGVTAQAAPVAAPAQAAPAQQSFAPAQAPAMPAGIPTMPGSNIPTL